MFFGLQPVVMAAVQNKFMKNLDRKWGSPPRRKRQLATGWQNFSKLGTTKKDEIEADTLRLSIFVGLVDDEEDGQHNVGASPKVLRPTSMTWIANRPGVSKDTTYKGAASECSHIVLFIRSMRPPPPPIRCHFLHFFAGKRCRPQYQKGSSWLHRKTQGKRVRGKYSVYTLYVFMAVHPCDIKNVPKARTIKGITKHYYWKCDKPGLLAYRRARCWCKRCLTGDNDMCT